MKKLTYILVLLTIGAFLNSCSDDPEFTKNLNFVSFEFSPVTLGVDVDGSTVHTFNVYTSNISSSDRTFSILVDSDATTAEAAAYSVPATVTVPANSNEGTIEITLNDVNIGEGKKIVLKFEGEDGLHTSGAATVNIKQICSKNEVFLDIVFDGYASECSWELLDSSDEVIASGAGYTDGLASLSTSFCLDNGTYTFVVYDAYGDGLSYPTNGSVTLSKDGEELFSAEGDYGVEASGTFTVNM